MSVKLDKRIAAVTRWAPTTAEQRRAATEPMRTARDEQFWQAAVEALGPDADPSAVGETARRLRTLHMLQLSRRSAQVRAARKAGTPA